MFIKECIVSWLSISVKLNIRTDRKLMAYLIETKNFYTFLIYVDIKSKLENLFTNIPIPGSKNRYVE